jgi:hypothetical protein
MGILESLRLFSGKFGRSKKQPRDAQKHRQAKRKAEGAGKKTRPRKLSLEQFEKRELLSIAPNLVAVIPNEGQVLEPGSTLFLGPRELLLRFNEGQQIDSTSLGGILFVRSVDGTFDNGDDQVVSIGYAGVADRPNEVIVRFAGRLEDDLYRMIIVGIDGYLDPAGNPVPPLRNTQGQRFREDRPIEERVLEFDFRVNLGPMVAAVVPQPVVRNVDGSLSQLRNVVEVYFNEPMLSGTQGVEAPEFYQLLVTRATANPNDDTILLPSQVVYDAALRKATLIFENDLATYGTGVFRLRLGDRYQPTMSEFVTAPFDAGQTFATAIDVRALPGTLPAQFGDGTAPQSLIISGQINNWRLDPTLWWPGGNDEPGHRNLPQFGAGQLSVENHYSGGDSSPDNSAGVVTISYYFPEGPFNLITEAQKQRAREVFALLSYYLGIQIYEDPVGGGIAVMTGDLAMLGFQSAPGGIAGLGGSGVALMDYAENWGASEYGGSWFQVAMHEIMHNLGFGHAYDQIAIMGSAEYGGILGGVEPVYPLDNDVLHGQHMFRPDSIDIDLYRVQLDERGLLRAEIRAERLGPSSLLDATLTLYEEYVENGITKYRLVARNDDYFSEDSYIELYLKPGIYYVGIAASGNNKYDPTNPDTGVGGRSQGDYQLRLTYQPRGVNSSDPETFRDLSAAPWMLVDETGVLLDGDGDGVPGGVYNYWFNVQDLSRHIFVDKLSPVPPAQQDGSLSRPYSTISAALAAAGPGRIVRIVGNNFEDDNPADPATLRNNIAYEIGYNRFGNPLSDGFKMEVPKGVTVMIDAGAVFKLAGANIDVGSSSELIDRSGGALQVLGTPLNRVYFTSHYDETIGTDSDPQRTTPRRGDWGGLVFRNDLDYQFIAAYDPALGQSARQVLETEGIFLNFVNYADIRFGGGEVVVDGVRSAYAPIHMVEARPTVTFNVITNSAGAAMSADPNSFRDSRFDSWNRWQPFTVDYDRVGPAIHNNVLVASYATSIDGPAALQRNSMNAIAIRVDTPAGGELKKLTTFARWDDWDIVHVVPENLILAGTPGGPITKARTIRNLQAANEYELSPPTSGADILDGEYFALFDGNTRVVFEFDLDSVERVVPGRKRIPYQTTFTRAQLAQAIAQAINEARLERGLRVTAQVVGNTVRLIPDSAVWKVEGLGLMEARIDARLHVDPGMTVKLTGSRIEVEFGAQLIAEGRPGPREDAPGYRTVLTSIYDARYGAGGVFDTLALTVPRAPAPGDWGGIHFAPTSSGSLDFAVVAYAGGVTRIEGGFARFNPIEIYQSDVRVTRSRLEFNDAVADPTNRGGRGSTTPATIFIRGAQPIIVANDFLANRGYSVSVDANALKAINVPDWGRSTGFASVYIEYANNWGPMIRANRFGMVDNPALRNQYQGLEVRAATLTTQSVWDDVDIVHIVTGEIVVGDLHHIGGLRLQSSEAGSLVVKLQGASAGFRATGTAREVDDRIGGILQIVGLPGRPVILTSLRDDAVGAGFDLLGRPVFDTNADGPSVGQPGDWNGVIFDRYAHDRNVAVVTERELPAGVTGDPNGLPLSSQFLGALAPEEKAGDENLRLGFTVHGFIRSDDPQDVDVYRFDAVAGTQVWIDIDWTSFALDTVVELITAEGTVIARSDNSHEFQSFEHKTDPDGSLLGLPMDRDVFNRRDFFTMNPRDAGLRVVLPGPAGQVRSYYVRVRSPLGIGNINPADVQEEMQFRIFDQDGRTVLFEFDRDGLVASGAIPVAYQGLTALELAQNIVDAVSTAGSTRGLKVSARLRLDRVLDSSGNWVQVPHVILDGVRAEFDPGSSRLTRIANTSGAYQLQIRLQEMQEWAGCSVEYADIRYPTTGVSVRGFPQHSPLLGESADVEGTGTGQNNTLASAQYLGNLLTSDRNVISVAGYLAGRTDIDWYRVDIDLTGIQSIGGFNDLGSLWSTIFDIDYADGMGRPDLSMWVFDSAGRLIYFGTNSNVGDDRALPFGPTLEDLTRGSVGARDPYIGPAFLPEGNRTYYVAITSVLATPRVLSSVLGGTTLSGDDSAWSADPTANPLVRVEPLPSVRRIVEEHIDTGPNSNVDVLNPNVSDTASRARDGEQRLALIPDEFQLGDVNFFALTGTDLFIVNPFTGAVVSDLTDWTDDYLPGSPSIYYRDIAMRNDGRLMTVSIGPGANFNPRYREFDTGNANTLLVDVDTGINVYRIQPGTTTTVEEDPGRSVYIEAIVHDYRNTDSNRGRTVLVVGDIRPALPDTELARAGITHSKNLVWLLSADGGAINHPRINDGSQPSGARLFSNIVPVGWLDTSAYSADPTNPASITGLAYLELPGIGNRLFAVDNEGNVYFITNETSAYASGGSWGFAPQSPSGGPNFVTYTGGGPQLTWIGQVRNPATGSPIAFSGLAAGPRNVEHGKYAYTLFASDSAGNIWALEPDMFGADPAQWAVRLRGVFVNAQTSINPPSPVGVIHGIDFSPIDYNLWHWTERRWNDAGHGLYNTVDVSRVGAEGYDPIFEGRQSYYFGLDDPNDNLSNESQPGAVNFTTAQGSDGSRVMTYNMPGGIWGSLTSGTFSLAGYTAADKPTLYFTYYAHTENSLDYDGLRVYVSNDGANWTLVATNTDLNDGAFIRDRLEKPGYGGYIREIHDGGGSWRQARIDLSQFAGQDNLRIRFDFSTASDMDIGNLQTQGAYLTVKPAAELRDGQTFVMGGVTFEIDMGYALVIPNAAGAKIGDNPSGNQRGEYLTISDGTRTYTFEFDKNGVVAPGRVRVPITDAMTARQVAETLARVINQTFGTTAPTAGRVFAYVPEDNTFQGANGNRVFLIGAVSVTQGTDYAGVPVQIQVEGSAPGQVAGGRTAVYLRPDMDQLTVAQVVSATINRRFRGTPAGSVPERIVVPAAMTAGQLNNTALSILGLDSQNVPRFAVVGFSTTSPFNQIVPVSAIQAQLPAGATLDADYAVIVGLSGAARATDIASRLASAINLLRTTYGWNVTATATPENYVELTGPQTVVTLVNVRVNGHPIPRNQTPASPLLRFDPNETTVKLDERFVSSGSSSNNLGASRAEPLIRVFSYSVTNAGPFSYSATLQGDTTNKNYGSGNNQNRFQNFRRGQNNAFEGWYIDDIIIGFAERGELVTNAPADVTDFDFLRQPRLDETIIVTGSYQLEVRRAHEFGTLVGPPSSPYTVLRLSPQVDTNDRFVQEISIRVPAASELGHGDRFWIDDGVRRQEFVFQDNTLRGPTGGAIAIYFDRAESGIALAQKVADAINQATAEGRLKVQALRRSVSDTVDLWGAAYVGGVLGGEENALLSGVRSAQAIPQLIYGSLEAVGTRYLRIEAPDGNSIQHRHTFRVSDRDGNVADFIFINQLTGESPPPGFYGITYGFGMPSTQIAVLVRDAINQARADGKLNITASISIPGRVDLSEEATDVIGLPYTTFFVPTPPAGVTYINPKQGNHPLIGDKNQTREKGQIIISGAQVLYASQWGIRVEPAARDAGGNWPHPASGRWMNAAYPQNLPGSMWVAGVALVNNIVAYSGQGGIYISGDTGNPPGAIPFVRVVNNTVVGNVLRGQSATGVGIQVGPNATPTLLNNVIAGWQIGIQVDSSSTSTVVGGTAFARNVQNVSGTTTGSFAILLGAADPLFVAPDRNNFYPADGARIIDSAIDSLAERSGYYSAVLQPVGIAPSPILAPTWDIYGQLRQDDPRVAPPAGMGSNVFKDRGAVDRVDFSGPTAALTVPMDNDPLDRNRAVDDVSLAHVRVTQFEISLYDVGIGIEDASVVAGAVAIYRDDRQTPLASGTDYLFSYDVTNNKIILYPAPGIWEPGYRYTIVLDRNQIQDLAGNKLQPNRPVAHPVFGDCYFQVSIDVLDYGDAPETPGLPAGGYPTAFVNNGARHLIVDGFALGPAISRELAPRAEDSFDDGVVFQYGGEVRVEKNIARPLEQHGVTVYVSVPSGWNVGPNDIVGYLNAWIDFNRDGDWNDDWGYAGEYVLQNVPLKAGENVFDLNTGYLVFTVPREAEYGPTWARFRLTTYPFTPENQLGVTGLADDGEVEDYQIELVEYYRDWGDAPAPYKTLRADGGPYHAVWPEGNPYLAFADPVSGQTTPPDWEPDGQPDPNALGDDLDSVFGWVYGRAADEAGAFIAPLNPSRVPRITVGVVGGGYLNAWIDINQDGDFDDAGEQIVSGLWLDEGQHELHEIPGLLPILPEDMPLGYTVVRLRLSSNVQYLGPDGGNPDPNGPAPNGEIEDHRVLVELAKIDFGDAPDPTYPSRVQSDGARHLIVDGYQLGWGVTRDRNAPAEDQFDDGVVFQYGHEIRVQSDPARPQEQYLVRVYVGVPDGWPVGPGGEVGYLNAWIDFHRDGDWDDPADQIFQNVPVQAGWNNLTFLVPYDAQFGWTWSRFRLSSEVLPSSGGYLGESLDGEVEDYSVRLVPYYRDWGDAPAPYRTLESQNGAYHAIWPQGNPYLAFPDPASGLMVAPDWEVDGQPDAEARGDDLGGWAADENGARGHLLTSEGRPILVAGMRPALSVYAASAGWLNMWIDLNQDGDWDDPNEQIVQGLWLEPGEHRLHEIAAVGILPNTLTEGDTFLRLRFSSNVQYLLPYGGNPDPAGPDPNGEVEDHWVRLERRPLDFGDAPDPTYPARLASDGARHLIVDGFALGTGVSAESDASAGDSLDDGVQFQFGGEIRVEADPSQPQERHGVRLYVSVPAGWPVLPDGTVGYVNAWIDFNRDGDWGDSAEWIFSNVPIRAGWNQYDFGSGYLVFSVPYDAALGSTWSRFRLSSYPIVAPSEVSYQMELLDGEVEDYEVKLVDYYRDWGDAPAPYPTLAYGNGAYHVVWPVDNPHLGYPVAGQAVPVDWELDGQPDPQALGDDQQGWPDLPDADDENGVQIVALTAGARPIMSVYAASAGWLNMWIDLNRDGGWDDPNEQIVHGLWLEPGEHQLHLIPEVAVLREDLSPGVSYMRLRFSSNVQYLQPTGGNPDPTGPAPNGEVEDHQVLLLVEPRDYGDAPSDRYLTRRENDGARHVVVPGFALGADVDEELNARPEDNGDDGVLFQYWGEIRVEKDPAWPVERHGVQVYVSVPAGWPVLADGTVGYLNAWIDFNRDGDWDDAWAEDSEYIFQNVPLQAGWNNFDFDSGYLVFSVPREAEFGKTWVRFRLTGAPMPVGGTPGYLGLAADGEVEDYEVELVPFYKDWGDAPTPYPTLKGDGGAYHVVWPRNNPFLALPDPDTGDLTEVDWYLDGLPNAGATGDDEHWLDDENGVRMWFVSPGFKPMIQVYAATPGYLNAWIDINQDGDWNDLGEQLISGVWIDQPGLYWLHELTALQPLPADMPLGETFLRFRFSSNVQFLLPYGGNPDPAGPDPNGEVEDYRIEVLRPSLDFGDAPESYRTLLLDNGPRHLLVPTGVYLGFSPGDEDVDGQPDTSAQADDWTDEYDEDGLIQIGSIVAGQFLEGRLIRGELAEFAVQVTGTGYLGAWIDWNGDGQFADYVDRLTGQQVRESIVQAVYVADDTVPFVFRVHVPSSAAVGPTFLRLRYSSDREAVLLPFGPGPDGEVEDHLVPVEEVTGVIAGTKFNDANANGLWELWLAIFQPTIQPIQPGTGTRILVGGFDSTVGPIDLGFDFAYYGALYRQFYVSENGAISFGSAVSAFDPAGFPEAVPMIAPFWANVDLRLGGGQVELARGVNPVTGNPFVQVTWVDVGYYNRLDPQNLPELGRRNTFAVYIEDDPQGDIVAFIYYKLQWSTADYFDPRLGLVRTGGYGDPGAEIGFNAGNNFTFARLTRPIDQGDLDALVSQQVFGVRIDANTGRPVGPEYGIPGGVIYLDANENGVRDPGEAFVYSQPDIRVTPDDETGRFQFVALPPGTYVVREDISSPQWQEWIQTYPWRNVVAYMGAGDLPVIALPPNELLDGQTFEVFDGRQILRFEFDRNFAAIDPQAVPVSIADLTDATEVAVAMADAINSARFSHGLQVRAAAVDDQVILTGDPVIFIPRDYPWTVRFSAIAGSAIPEGAIFTVGDGVRKVTFEFDWDGVSAYPGSGYVLINVAGRTPTEVASAIVSAIQSAAAANGMNVWAIQQGSEVILRGRTLTVDRRSSFLPGSPVRLNGDGSYTVNLEAGDVLGHLDFGNFLRPRVTVNDVRVLEGNTGQFTEVQVDLTWLQSFGAEVDVVVSTQDGSASLVDNDYIPYSDVLRLRADVPPRTLWPTRTLTSNNYGDYDYGISGTTLVYQVLDSPSNGGDWEIWLYDLATDTFWRVTDNQLDDRFPAVYQDGATSYVVWVGGDPTPGQTDGEVFLRVYRSGEGFFSPIIRLTNNAYEDSLPRIHDRLITWVGQVTASNSEIFVFNYRSGLDSDWTVVQPPRNISNSPFADLAPQTYGGWVVWYGWDGFDEEIYSWSAATGTRRITRNTLGDRLPKIHGNILVWEQFDGQDYEIWMHNLANGTTRQLTDNTTPDVSPAVWGDHVVWQGTVGTTRQILYMNLQELGLGLPPVNISANPYDNRFPQIDGDRVVWHARVDTNFEVFVYDLGTAAIAQNISRNPATDWYPIISGDTVVWRNWDGTDYEITIAEYLSPRVVIPIRLTIVGDNRVESDEYFWLQIHSATVPALGTGSVIVDQQAARIWIHNDDDRGAGWDFGDAPASYGTLLSDDGARHAVDPAVYLGRQIDAEGNGQPSTDALGDDLLNIADEDGVTFLTPLIPGQTAQVAVRASVAGYLDAWVDFNRNGRWGDPADPLNLVEPLEQIFTSQPLVPGVNVLSFRVPSTASLGSTFARFRFSSTGGLLYVGSALDGEVEDYAVSIVAAAPTGVMQRGSTVYFYGTAGADRFEFSPATPSGGDHRVLFNGVEYRYRASQVENIVFHAQAGVDTAILNGTAGNETAELRSGWALLTGSQFLVAVTSAENVTVNGRGGNDLARLAATAGVKDTVVGTATYVQMTTGSVVNRVNNFQTVLIQGNPGEGSDVVRLYGSSAIPETFVGGPTSVTLDGGTYRIQAENFRWAYGYGNGSADKAELYDNPTTRDWLVADPTYARISGPGFYVFARDFAEVVGYATPGGNDGVTLYDNPASTDTFVAEPARAELSGSSYRVEAYGFRYVSAQSSGGSDLAVLYDDPVAVDRFEATPTYGVYYGTTFNNRAFGFAEVRAVSRGGNDRARFYDNAALQESFVAYPTYATLIGPTYLRQAEGFRYVMAYSGGGGDQALLYGSNGNDTFVARPFEGRMYGTGYDNQVSGFRRVSGVATGAGYDLAQLFDLALNWAPDHLQAQANWAKVSNSLVDYELWAIDFDKVEATGSDVGVDTKEIIGALDYLLETFGSWA